MPPRSDANPEATGFGRRLPLPGRIRSFPALRIAALWEAFLVAAASLRQNKLRTALTLVGIIVGVTAVISVVTIIKGLDQTVAQTFSSQRSTVFTALGRIFAVSRDTRIYIPFATYKKTFGLNISRGAFSASGVLVVFIQTPTAEQLEGAEDQVRAIMRNRRGKTGRDEDDGFAVESEDVLLNLYSTSTPNIYLVTIGVAAISLVVGGIVVMNIMLVSVTERTKEIGIRKAVGARQKDIRTQFLIEAVMVTAIGGVVGVLTGFGVAWLIALLIGFPLLFSIWSAVLGVSMSSIVRGIIGLWPAWRAARLDPIEALRAE